MAQTDPILFSTYLGGSSFDQGNAIASRDGWSYVVGITRSPDFPVRNAVQPRPPEAVTFPVDGFLSIFDPVGRLFYSSYFADSLVDYLQAVAVGSDGRVYMAGVLQDLAETSARVARFDPFTRETFFFRPALSGRSAAQDVAVDAQGNVYVTGVHFRMDPVFGVFLPRAFVAKLNSAGEEVYLTAFDGMDYEQGNAVVLDSEGNAYVGGVTASPDFPIRQALQIELRGPEDGFVTKLDPSGVVVFSTYLGGSGRDRVEGLALNSEGGVWVTGTTRSPDFPTLGAAQSELNGSSDLFLARLGPTGELVASTYLGGSGEDVLGGVASNRVGSLILAGPVVSPDSPLVPAGCTGSFLAQLAPDFQVLNSSCIPGAVVRDAALDSAGRAYLTGNTTGGLPAVDAFQPSPQGGQDAFVTKLQLNRPPDCSAAVARPATIWPPNGRLVPVSILGVTDHDGELVTLTVTGVRQDEPLTRPGTPDATGIGTAAPSLRADRAGRGDGRVYRLSLTATDPQGASCTRVVTVCVPHDLGRRQACGDGGGLFDSGR